MRAVRHRANIHAHAAPVADASSQELTDRLRTMQDRCLTELAGALEAMCSGDLTVTVTPVTKPIDFNGVPEDQRELVELFNSMLGKAQTAIHSYNTVRAQLAGALGDHSSIESLQQRLTSLSDNCLTGLADGLAAAAEGDLTVDAHPVTQPLAAPPTEQLGQLGQTFNEMLDKAQGAGGVSRAGALPSSPTRCASWPSRPRRRPMRPGRHSTGWRRASTR